MGSINIENGQTIEDLATIEQIDKDSWFLVTSEGLTYNINLSNLRKQFVGDSMQEMKDELFYSCQYMDTALEEVRQLVLKGSQTPIDQLNNKIDALEQSMNNKFTEVNNKITQILNMIS